MTKPFWYENTESEFTDAELRRIVDDPALFRAFLRDYGARGLLTIKRRFHIPCITHEVLRRILCPNQCNAAPFACASFTCETDFRALVKKFGRGISPADSIRGPR